MTQPGDVLLEMLDKKGWTQTDLSNVTGKPTPTINGIIKGKRSVTPELAVALASAFGNEPTFWLDLESQKQLSGLPAVDEAVRRRARCFEIAPVKEMQKRGWIKPTAVADELEEELKRFFNVPNLDEEPRTGAATRKSDAEEPLTPGQRAWCFKVRQMAGSMAVPPYNPDSMESCKRELRKLAAFPQEAYKVSQALAKYGIRFVVVEPLQGIKVDGVALWLDDNSPVIGMSVRYDRIDSFWFTLCHELSHIIHRDEAPLDADLTDKMEGIMVVRQEMERRADEEAAETLIAQNEMESFILRVGPLYSKKRIIGFANRIKMHPGIIVGQLQRRAEIGYYANRELLSKVRDLVITTSRTDGWGHTPDPRTTR